jgi:hypothetical protein
MTQRQLDVLGNLLQRVQQNRRAPRAARGAAAVAAVAPAPVVAAVPAAPSAMFHAEPDIAFDDVNERTPAPPPPPPRRPGLDRRATPLEMAVAGELEQQLAAASEARAIVNPVAAAPVREAPAAAPKAEIRREAPVEAKRDVVPKAARALAEPMADVEALQALQPPQSGDIMEPRIIEPDPPREVVRPIAQVMSKHAPAVDATFGAMLKRSLSLRPH